MTKCAVPFVAAAMALASIAGAAPAAASPPAGGSISIEPNIAGGKADPATQPFVSAATEALAAQGFTILEDPGHAAYVAELILSRTEVGTGSAKIRTGGASAASGAYGGVGVGASIPLAAGSELVPLQRTQLEVRIRKRGEEAVVWDGAAVTVRAAGTRKGADEAVAADLSAAILRGYPVAPEGVIGVP